MMEYMQAPKEDLTLTIGQHTLKFGQMINEFNAAKGQERMDKAKAIVFSIDQYRISRPSLSLDAVKDANPSIRQAFELVEGTKIKRTLMPETPQPAGKEAPVEPKEQRKPQTMYKGGDALIGGSEEVKKKYRKEGVL